MLTKKQWAGIAGLVGFGFLFSLLIPAYDEICHTNPDTHQKYCTSYHIALVVLWHIGELLNYYGVAVTAGASFAIAIFTRTLWLTSQEQLRHSRVIERAFIFNSGFLPPSANLDFAGNLRSWIIVAVLQNSGSTPTKFMQMHISCRTFDGEPPPNFDFPDLWSPGEPHRHIPLFIGPKAYVWGPGIELNIVELDHILHKRKRALIWGWVDYNDVFPDTPRHRTEFCSEVSVVGDPKNPAHITMRTYPHFNGADETCTRSPESYETT